MRKRLVLSPKYKTDSANNNTFAINIKTLIKGLTRQVSRSRIKTFLASKGRIDFVTEQTLLCSKVDTCGSKNYASNGCDLTEGRVK